MVDCGRCKCVFMAVVIFTANQHLVAFLELNQYLFRLDRGLVRVRIRVACNPARHIFVFLTLTERLAGWWVQTACATANTAFISAAIQVGIAFRGIDFAHRLLNVFIYVFEH